MFCHDFFLLRKKNHAKTDSHFLIPWVKTHGYKYIVPPGLFKCFAPTELLFLNIIFTGDISKIGKDTTVNVKYMAIHKIAGFGGKE